MMLSHGMRKSWRFGRRVFGLVAVFGLLAVWGGARPGNAETVNVTILHTNNVTGHIYPCPT
jgi:hypothetical protein